MPASADRPAAVDGPDQPDPDLRRREAAGRAAPSCSAATTGRGASLSPWKARSPSSILDREGNVAVVTTHGSRHFTGEPDLSHDGKILPVRLVAKDATRVLRRARETSAGFVG